PAPLRRRHPDADARDPRRQGLPGTDRRGAAVVARAVDALRAAGGGRRVDGAPVPVLPAGEPLGALATAREGLVLGRAGLPGRARARGARGGGRPGPADDARLTPHHWGGR